MTDPRNTPDAALMDQETPAQIIVPVAELLRSPSGPRDRQLLYGDMVTVLHQGDGFSLLRAQKDGYCGWVADDALGPPVTATHQVTARATHAYARADFKSPDRLSLSFGSHLAALSETPTFIETVAGFVPRQHVHPVGAVATDPAAIAALFLGTPYLWGGNSYLGIDCSGLVQAACLACGIACPGDSDQQAETLGTPLGETATLRRNDLIFWKGHVAIVSDETTLIHANAGHMSTVYEPMSEALARIETQGDGPPLCRRRLPVNA